MTRFEEELNNLEVSQSTKYTDYWNKAKLLTVFKDWKPQQYLPVVPECVAEFITKVKKSDNNLTFAFNSKFDECPAKYWNEAIVWRLNHPEEFALAFITGKYQVEKPQLFYLKNKLTGLNLVLEQCFNPFGKHVGERFREFDMQYIATDEQEVRLYKNTFTQEEIDSMETGSYEQIEVAE